ncbi:hypothetical protein [Clostridium ljungdahlii]|uniref:Uncharacterized protein n=1 Tax=Clostridium ljungdahlii TaxID=1538 RepID=A0A162L2G5_9CLOT|nr:hypothetical protein [Clostridium ljungdahlii]OAA90202.1 hypothetical protein WY13_01105 [Clostridium ljungdahlii]
MFFEALKHVRKKFIGTKKDKVTSYTENELLNFMDLSYNNLKVLLLTFILLQLLIVMAKIFIAL